MVKRDLQLKHPKEANKVPEASTASSRRQQAHPPFSRGGDDSASSNPELVDLSQIHILNRQDIDRIDTASCQIVTTLDESAQRIERELNKL